MRLVVIESPYAGEVEANVAYARRCLRDCLRRGEAPLASHLLYTQPNVLDDGNAEERALGIRAGLTWGMHAHASIVYVDRGISEGMAQGILHAIRVGHRLVEFRQFGEKTEGPSEKIPYVHIMWKLDCESPRMWFEDKTGVGLFNSVVITRALP